MNWTTTPAQRRLLAELICTIATEDMHGLESRLHKRFADKRANGEWFLLDEADVEYIRGLADGQ